MRNEQNKSFRVMKTILVANQRADAVKPSLRSILHQHWRKKVIKWLWPMPTIEIRYAMAQAAPRYGSAYSKLRLAP
jgi:hypothetical protein